MQSIIPTTTVERVITCPAIYDIMCTPAIQRFIDIPSLHHQTCIIKRYSFVIEGKTGISVEFAIEEIVDGNLVFPTVCLDNQMVSRTVEHCICKLGSFKP